MLKLDRMISRAVKIKAKCNIESFRVSGDSEGGCLFKSNQEALRRGKHPIVCRVMNDVFTSQFQSKCCEQFASLASCSSGGGGVSDLRGNIAAQLGNSQSAVRESVYYRRSQTSAFFSPEFFVFFSKRTFHLSPITPLYFHFGAS